MTTGSRESQDTSPHEESASEEDRIPVLVRLRPDHHRDMKLAMAHAGIRTNQDFAEAAIAAHAETLLESQRDPDRRRTARRRRDTAG